MKKLSIIFGLIFILGLLLTPALPSSLRFDFDNDPSTWETEWWLTEIGDTMQVDVYINDVTDSVNLVAYTFQFDVDRLECIDCWPHDLTHGGPWENEDGSPASSCDPDLVGGEGENVVFSPDYPFQGVNVVGKEKLNTILLKCKRGDSQIQTIDALYLDGSLAEIDIDEEAVATIYGACGVSIDPPSTEVGTGQTKQFNPIKEGVACEGLSPPPSYSWELSSDCGSSINQNGLYTACCLVNMVDSPETITVTDTEYGDTNIAVVKVLGYRITGITPDIQKIESDKIKKFSAETANCCPKGDALFQWSLDPSTTLDPLSTIDPDTGEYRAGINRTGGEVSETIKVEDLNNCCDGECASKEKSIQVKPCTVMDLQPKENNIINAGETLKFREAGGTCCAGVEYTWELTVDEDIGSTLNATGLYRAGRYFLECQPVTETIMIADACGSQDTADVTVRPVQVLVDTESETLQPLDFIFLKDLEPYTLCADEEPCYTWSLSSKSTTQSGGVIIEEIYIAGPCNGTDIITATDTCNYNATADAGIVTVENGIDCEVYISPLSASVNAGETQQFSATKFCNFCDPCSWEVISDIGSVIDANGLYTAGSSPGTDTVKIICSGDEDTAEVTVSGSITTTSIEGSTTTTTAGLSTTTTLGPITTTTAGPITTTTVSPTTTTITDTTTTTTITDTTTTTTTIITKSIEVSPTEVVRSRWVPLFWLMNIKGTGTNFELFKTRVDYDTISVLTLPALILHPEDIWQLILVMPSLLTGIGFDGESETVTVMVEGVSDTFEIKMLPAPLDEEKNLK